MASQSQTEAEGMSLEQARAVVIGLIASGEKLFATPADQNHSPPELLGPVTWEFFSRYAMLRTRHGGLELSVASINASEHVRGFVSIGHSEDWDVVQHPGTDEVFVVEGSETSEVEMEVRFPSVYHLILSEALMT